MRAGIRYLLSMAMIVSFAAACGGPTDPGLPEPEDEGDQDPTENSDQDPGTALLIPAADGPVIVDLPDPLLV
ncbi:MAG: hypothetical protein ACOC8B_01505 [Gemmatimonadota bacterium]